MDSLMGIYLAGLGIVIALLLFFSITIIGDITFGFFFWLLAAMFFGKEFFFLSFPGLPDIFLERVIFIPLLAVFVYQIWTGKERLLKNTALEYLMLFMLAILVVSMSRTGFLAITREELQPFSVFLSGFFFPFFFYYFGKTMIYSEKRVQILLWTFFPLLVYLVLVSYLEHFKLYDFIFPRYIANPLVGIHFGRARGPFLTAPVNGWIIGSLFIITLFLRSRISDMGMRFWMSLVLLLSIPALFYTYTRAVWLSFLIAPLLVILLSKRMVFRARFLVFPLCLLLLYVSLNWQNIISPTRETGGVFQVSEVQDRLALFEATKTIFKDYPLYGVGFGRFGRAAAQYYSTLGLRVDIRATAQHNIFFSLVSELGIIGLIPFILILFLILRYSWLLYRHLGEEGMISRDLIVTFWGILVIYLVNASFIQTQYFTSANCFLFVWIGTIVGLYQRKVLMQGPDQEPSPA